MSNTHVSTDWEISEHRDFSIIKYSKYNDTANLTALQYIDVNNAVPHYCRVRYRASPELTSDWSNVSSFVIPVSDSSTEDPICYVKIQHYYGVLVDFQLTSSFNYTSPTTNIPISTTWQIATDINFHNLVYNETSTTNLTSIITSGINPAVTYFCRLRHVMSISGETQWSNINSFQAAIPEPVINPPYINYPKSDDMLLDTSLIASIDQPIEVIGGCVPIQVEWQFSLYDTFEPLDTVTYYTYMYSNSCDINSKEKWLVKYETTEIYDMFWEDLDAIRVTLEESPDGTTLPLTNLNRNKTYYLRAFFQYADSGYTDWSNTVIFTITGTPKPSIIFPVDGDYAVNKCEVVRGSVFDTTSGLTHEWTEYGYIDSTGSIVIVRRVTVATIVVSTRITLTTLPLAMIPSSSKLVIRYKAVGTSESPWSEPVSYEYYKQFGTFSETARFGNVNSYYQGKAEFYYIQNPIITNLNQLATDSSGDILAHFNDVAGLQVYRRTNGIMQLEASLASFIDICGPTPYITVGTNNPSPLPTAYQTEYIHRQRQVPYLTMSKDGSTIAIGNYQSHINILYDGWSYWSSTYFLENTSGVLIYYKNPTLSSPVITGHGTVRIYKYGSSGWYLHTTLNNSLYPADKSGFGRKVQLSTNGDRIAISDALLASEFSRGYTGQAVNATGLTIKVEEPSETAGHVHVYTLTNNVYVKNGDIPIDTNLCGGTYNIDYALTHSKDYAVISFVGTPELDTILVGASTLEYYDTYAATMTTPVTSIKTTSSNIGPHTSVNVGGYYQTYKLINGTYIFDRKITIDLEDSSGNKYATVGPNTTYNYFNYMQIQHNNLGISIADDIIYLDGHSILTGNTIVLRKTNGVWGWSKNDIYQIPNVSLSFYTQTLPVLIRNGELLINNQLLTPWNTYQSYDRNNLPYIVTHNSTTCGVNSAPLITALSNIAASDDGTKIFTISRQPVTPPNVYHPYEIYNTYIAETKYTPRIS